MDRGDAGWDRRNRQSIRTKVFGGPCARELQWWFNTPINTCTDSNTHGVANINQRWAIIDADVVIDGCNIMYCFRRNVHRNKGTFKFTICFSDGKHYVYINMHWKWRKHEQKYDGDCSYTANRKLPNNSSSKHLPGLLL